jgi:polygalacturonase
VIYLPPGRYTSGPFNFTSNATLLLDHATLISAAKNASQFGIFKLIPPLPSYGEGRDQLPNDLNGRYEPFIGAYNVSGVTITTNSSGIIHGRGYAWWVANFDDHVLLNTPPHLFEAAWSSDISIGAPPGSPRNALILKDSPFWNVHLYDCDHSWVHDATILADPLYYNTDGVDPDSSRDTLIERVDYIGGDDGVAIKSGWDDAGIRYGVPVSGVVVRDSTFTTPSSCVCVGSEMSGGAGASAWRGEGWVWRRGG